VKKICVVMMGLLMLICRFSALAQQGGQLPPVTVQPYRLEVSLYKTMSLVFPEAIKSVDRGSKDLLVQKANGVDNILQVKAAKENFEETSLTVVTSDGQLYAFLVVYVEKPGVLNLLFGRGDALAGAAQISGTKYNEVEVRCDAETAAFATMPFKPVTAKKYGIDLDLNGIFIRGDVLYVRMRMENRSNINYDIDQLRFFFRDRKKSKRTASQEIEVKPLFTFQDAEKIVALTGNTFVFALPKFTLPDSKYLILQVMEKDGGRHHELKIKNKVLMQAGVLP